MNPPGWFLYGSMFKGSHQLFKKWTGQMAMASAKPYWPGWPASPHRHQQPARGGWLSMCGKPGSEQLWGPHHMVNQYQTVPTVDCTCKHWIMNQRGGQTTIWNDKKMGIWHCVSALWTALIIFDSYWETTTWQPPTSSQYLILYVAVK